MGYYGPAGRQVLTRTTTDPGLIDRPNGSYAVAGPSHRSDPSDDVDPADRRVVEQRLLADPATVGEVLRRGRTDLG